MQASQQADSIDISSEDNRKQAAVLVSRLFEKWALDNNSRLSLIGLSSSSRSVLKGYREGTRALPNTRDTLDRVGWLMAIHKALRLLYPRNPELRDTWVTHRNEAFDNLAPIDVMLEGGLIGIARVSRYLDYYRGR